MIVVAAEQTKRSFCIALLNYRLNKNSKCPANHDVYYRNGWFYLDDEVFQDPGLTRLADNLIQVKATVHFSSLWNTHIIVDDELFNADRELIRELY